MKKLVRLFFICCMLWVCYSCTSVIPLQLDIVRPARVSYSMHYPPLAVLCNSHEPNVSEYSRYIDANGNQYRMDFAGDSIPGFSLCRWPRGCMKVHTSILYGRYSPIVLQ